MTFYRCRHSKLTGKGPGLRCDASMCLLEAEVAAKESAALLTVTPIEPVEPVVGFQFPADKSKRAKQAGASKLGRGAGRGARRAIKPKAKPKASASRWAEYGRRGGRVGGASASPVKAAAAQVNGARGGRPKARV